jgi:hypothetical protein
MRKTVRCTAVLSFLILAGFAATGAAQAPAAPASSVPAVPMQWVAALFNMEGGGTTWVTVHADGFSSPTQVQALKDMLKDQGQTAVVNQLNAMPQIGWIRIGSTTGYPIPVIRYVPTATGYRIVLVCARPIGFAGAVRQGIVTTDYPIGVVSLDVNTKGDSKGQILPAVKVEFNEDGTFDPKVYGTAPLRLMQVREESAK